MDKKCRKKFILLFWHFESHHWIIVNHPKWNNWITKCLWKGFNSFCFLFRQNIFNLNGQWMFYWNVIVWLICLGVLNLSREWNKYVCDWIKVVFFLLILFVCFTFFFTLVDFESKRRCFRNLPTWNKLWFCIQIVQYIWYFIHFSSSTTLFGSRMKKKWNNEKWKQIV